MTALQLLPPNASQLEQLAAEALAQIERVPVPIRDLVNPDRCPVELLPYLAWAFSVDRWDATWSEAIKREVIKASYFVHSRKGTIGALRRVVEPLGYLIRVTEWWQQVPEGEPGTFSLEIGVLETGISEETYESLSLLIDDAKPVSRHLIGLDISLETHLTRYVGVTVIDGDELDVYPWENADIDVLVRGYSGVSDYILDEMDVYPHG
ncbi:phage tail protein I [Stutzerimonas nitrititolerans]|uniref:phage tail protein I n=1 Tax=Stutzerimonas nitrititolerans TaxID=2482751 RepID=UPI001BD6B35F|nr:phage tail protein I [Stutzerimonas nitrititolerans]